MNNKLTALALIAVTALSLAPRPAAASDKGLAVVGGFLGGLIVGSAISDSRYDSHRSPGTTVIVSGRNDRHDRGYWKTVSIKVWVPGGWIVDRGHHGRSYRRFVNGHYEYRTNRVWVGFDRYDRHDGRRDREVGSGYGRRR
jgi:hypothetical protein